MVMEASLLVAPKPSVSRTVSVFFPARRCIVAGAAKQQQDSSSGVELRGGRGLPAVAAAAAATAMMSGALPFQCLAAAAAAAPATHEQPWEVAEELYRAVAVVGELDPATARAVAGVAGPALSAFGFLFIVRIVMSWYPRLPVGKFPYVVAYAPTEPFLAVTRKVIPPLGGVDVTPVVWFGLVSFLNEILVGPQGLLVLLSQQKP